MGTWRRAPNWGAEKKAFTIGPSRARRILNMLRLRRRRSCLPVAPLDDMPPDIGVREPRRPRPFGGAGAVTLDPPQ